MPYIGTSPSNGVRRVHTYTATAGQTTFTGASSEGVTLSYADTNYIDVFQNGVLLGSADYTSTSGTSVVLAQGASADDLIVITVYDVFGVADTISKKDGGTFDGNVTMGGTLTVSGAFTSQGIDDNADATAVTIDSAEKVGIGQTTPVRRLHIKDTSADMYIGLEGGTSNNVGILMGDTDNHTLSRIRHDNSDNALEFHTNETERMRIDTNGNIIFNSSVYSTADARLVTSHDGNAQVGFAIRSTSSVAQSEKMIQFKKDNTSGVTEVGTITSNRTSTAYNTSSDYRLKENVSYSFDATSRLKQLKPARFNFIADESNTLIDGFLAHEVSNVVPEAITGEKDAMQVETRYTEDDKETQGDNPSKKVGDAKTYSKTEIAPQGIDQSKLVPLLVKTIQELEARITALENAE
jgi:hypothetical protein